jgi:hypothetical protein
MKARHSTFLKHACLFRPFPLQPLFRLILVSKPTEFISFFFALSTVIFPPLFWLPGNRERRQTNQKWSSFVSVIKLRSLSVLLCVSGRKRAPVEGINASEGRNVYWQVHYLVLVQYDFTSRVAFHSYLPLVHLIDSSGRAVMCFTHHFELLSVRTDVITILYCSILLHCIVQ